MEWNRVWAIGRDSYIRFYPNPGFGFKFGQRRIAMSVKGGIELYRAHPQHTTGWCRTWCVGSRVKHRGNKGEV